MQPRGINIIHLEDQKLMKEKIKPEDIKLKGLAGLTIRNSRPLTNAKGLRMSNTEWLSHICDTGHPIAQCFVLQALCTFADRVIEAEAEIGKGEDDKDDEGIPIISKELWVEIAKWLRLSFHYQYENKEEQSDAS